MRRPVWIALLAGAALFVGIIAYQGAGEVLSTVALAGWGLLAVVAWRATVILADARSWQVLLGRHGRGQLRRIAWAWWIGDAVNTLLPVAQVGGELVRARLLACGAVPAALAGASVVVGLTVGILTLVIFAAVGAVLLADTAADDTLLPPLLFGLLVLAGSFYGFYLAQRAGLFLRIARGVERLAQGRDWLALTGEAAALDQEIVELYRDRSAFMACAWWRLVGWLAGVGEVWLALYFLGHPVTLVEALILESLGQAVRSAGFAVPGALGVQEGGLLVLGALVGLPGEVAIGLSLVKRARELSLGLPGLAAWQVAEGTWSLRRR